MRLDGINDGDDIILDFIPAEDTVDMDALFDALDADQGGYATVAEREAALRFDGLNTDFRPFAHVLEFYAQIDNSLGGPGNARIRKFLRNASVDTLISLPKMDADHPVRAFENLNSEDLTRIIHDGRMI